MINSIIHIMLRKSRLLIVEIGFFRYDAGGQNMPDEPRCFEKVMSGKVFQTARDDVGKALFDDSAHRGSCLYIAAALNIL